MARRVRKGAPKPEQVKALRESSGFSQSHVAKLLDVDISALQRWESGQASMPGATWGYMQLLVLPAEDRDFVDQYGLVLSDKSEGWVIKKLDESDSLFVKGILVAALVSRGCDVPTDISGLAKFYPYLFVLMDSTRSKLLAYAADKRPFLRGFSLARLVYLEMRDD